MPNPIPPELWAKLTSPEYGADISEIVSLDMLPPEAVVLRLRLRSDEEIHLRIPAASLPFLRTLLEVAIAKLGTPQSGNTGRPN